MHKVVGGMVMRSKLKYLYMSTKWVIVMELMRRVPSFLSIS